MVANLGLSDINAGNVIGKVEVNFNFNRSIKKSKSLGLFSEETIPLYYIGIIEGLKDYNIKESEFTSLSRKILDRLQRFYNVSNHSLGDENTYHFDIKINNKLFHGIFEMYSTLIETYDINNEMTLTSDDQIISEVRIKIDFGQLFEKEVKDAFILAIELIHNLSEIFKIKLTSYFFTNKAKKQIKNESELKNYIERSGLFYYEDREKYRIFLPLVASVPEFLFNIAKL
ncbi:hypothetical protein M1585_02830 [Candidatus Parvarchaeota archaeon]|jgi:hypothetical protein|nr:hypothetical protein [Candidatus Parvarchaeota archaeon]